MPDDTAHTPIGRVSNCSRQAPHLFSDLSGIAASELDPRRPSCESGARFAVPDPGGGAIQKTFGVKIAFRDLLEECSPRALTDRRATSAARFSRAEAFAAPRRLRRRRSCLRDPRSLPIAATVVSACAAAPGLAEQLLVSSSSSCAPARNLHSSACAGSAAVPRRPPATPRTPQACLGPRQPPVTAASKAGDPAAPVRPGPRTLSPARAKARRGYASAAQASGCVHRSAMPSAPRNRSG